MVTATYFEHDLNTGLTHVQVDSFAYVLHLDQVGAVLSKECEQASKAARSVADACEDDEASASQSFVTSHQSGEQPEICVAA